MEDRKMEIRKGDIVEYKIGFQDMKSDPYIIALGMIICVAKDGLIIIQNSTHRRFSLHKKYVIKVATQRENVKNYWEWLI